MRAVFEMLGVRDVVAKSLGSTNPYNMVRATFDALKAQENPRGVASRRGKKVSEIVARRRDAGERRVRGRRGGSGIRRDFGSRRGRRHFEVM